MTMDFLLEKHADVRSLAERMVLSFIPNSDRSSVRVRLDRLLGDWEGREGDVLCVMHYAVQNGKADEYLGKLDSIYAKHLRLLPKANGYRRNLQIPAVSRTEQAVNELYAELGVKPKR